MPAASSNTANKTSGGLHGVGASVVMRFEGADRHGAPRRRAVEMKLKQGRSVGSLAKTGAARGSGTTVFFRPDATIFPKVEFDAELIRSGWSLELPPQGVRIVFEDERGKSAWYFGTARGSADYLKKSWSSGRDAVHELPFSITRKTTAAGCAWIWRCSGPSTDEHVRALNGIPTVRRTHESGFRAGLARRCEISSIPTTSPRKGSR